MMQARRADNCGSCDQKKAMGTFELAPDEKYLKAISCNNALNVSQHANKSL